MQDRDDNIYRVIFEADPIPLSIRKAGFGGVNRYKHLEKLSNSELVTETSKQIDIISKQIYIQSKSFDEVIELAKNKKELLSSLPSIQPVANKDLKRMVSGFISEYIQYIKLLKCMKEWILQHPLEHLFITG